MLRTARLLLRPWRDADLPAFAALNADPEVRRWSRAGPLTREHSDTQAADLRDHMAAHGFGFWAVEAPGVAPFMGFVGLGHVTRHVTLEAPFPPAVEVGWRLSRGHWGRGYATEAARAALAHGLGPLGLAEVVAFTARGNLASRRVMERIGMRYVAEVGYPGLPKDDPLRQTVLYRARQGDGQGCALRDRSGACLGPWRS